MSTTIRGEGEGEDWRQCLGEPGCGLLLSEVLENLRFPVLKGSAWMSFLQTQGAVTPYKGVETAAQRNWRTKESAALWEECVRRACKVDPKNPSNPPSTALFLSVMEDVESVMKDQATASFEDTVKFKERLGIMPGYDLDTLPKGKLLDQALERLSEWAARATLKETRSVLENEDAKPLFRHLLRYTKHAVSGNERYFARQSSSDYRAKPCEMALYLLDNPEASWETIQESAMIDLTTDRLRGQTQTAYPNFFAKAYAQGRIFGDHFEREIVRISRGPLSARKTFLDAIAHYRGTVENAELKKMVMSGPPVARHWTLVANTQGNQWLEMAQTYLPIEQAWKKGELPGSVLSMAGEWNLVGLEKKDLLPLIVAPGAAHRNQVLKLLLLMHKRDSLKTQADGATVETLGGTPAPGLDTLSIPASKRAKAARRR